MADDGDSAGSASSGSMFDVDLPLDTLTVSDHPPGLAAVFAGKAVGAAADDISDLLVKATNRKPFELLIVTGGSILTDAELSTSLRFQITSFQTQLRTVGIDMDAMDGGTDDQAPLANYSGRLDLLVAAPALVAIAKAGIGLLPSAAGLLGKLTAHQYTVSSATLEKVSLSLDLRVAGSIRAKLKDSATAHVAVERFWQPPNSTLITDLTLLARAYVRLCEKVANAATEVDLTKSALDQAVAAQDAGHAQLLELFKSITTSTSREDKSPWKEAWTYAESLAKTDAVVPAREHAGAAANLANLQGVQSALEAFLVASVTSSGDGGSTLSRAMRAEWLVGGSSRVILYVGTVAAGLDQVLDTKVGADSRVVLAGASVEYAAVGSSTRLMFAGAFDALWGGRMNLKDLKGFRSERVDYQFVANESRVEPPAASLGSDLTTT